MTVEPLFNFNFARTPGRIDPRWTFVRATAGRTVNRVGLIQSVPAGAPRFRFNPVTGLCEGLLVERQATNLLQRTEEFDHATWVKTGLTATANSAVAPDGTTTGDTLAATATNGNVGQAITITAGRGIALGVYAKANASNVIILSISDGSNSVECWFNLATGATGSNTTGGTAGGFTLTYSNKWIEAYRNGWYLCSLEVTTAVSTAITCAFAPAASDGVASASGNSVYAWGAQAEANSATTSLTSYIPNVSTAAGETRDADNLSLLVTQSQCPLDRGTLIFDTIQRAVPPVSGASIVWGGLANASGFTDYFYATRSGNGSIGATYNYTGSPASPTQPTRTITYAQGTNNRIAMSFSTSRHALCINGGAVSANTSNMGALTQAARIAIGMSPWASTSSNVVGHCVFRGFQYYPATLSDADMQALTAG